MITLHPHSVSPEITKSVVTVGNFDGVHKGHQQLIKTVVERARALDALSVIVTFEPHTRAVLNTQTPLHILTTCLEKEMLIRDLGIDILACIPFTQSTARLEPSQFLEQTLIGRFKAVEWVMGENHAFGKERQGTKNFLRDQASRMHINILSIVLSSQMDATISSTRIRSRIIDGKIHEAVEMLGHPYLIMAERIRGVQTGTKIGFPTLNFKLPPSQKVIPPPGVYAAKLEDEGTTWTGALYIGDCPTFEDRDYHMEFHALSGSDKHPPVGKTSLLWVHSFVRKDETFDSSESLVEQIQEDISDIREYFSKE